MRTGLSERRGGPGDRPRVRDSGLPALHPRDLASVLSMGLDLAEGKAMGHAQRLCYIGINLAQAAGMPPGDQAAVFYGCLLHDLGVPAASALLPQMPAQQEDQVFSRLPLALPEEIARDVAPDAPREVLRAIRAHPGAGASAASALGLMSETLAAIRHHHERWDGQGLPDGLAEEAIPLAARIVAAADAIDAFIASEQNPLAARSVAVDEVAYESGRALDPNLARLFAELARRDDFWLGLFDDRLSVLLPEMVQDGLRASRRAVARFAETVADVIDARSAFTRGHSARAADLSRRIALHLDLDGAHADLIGLAALWHNLGSLGVPRRIIAKPDILTLEERDLLYQHPHRGREIVGRLPGMEDVAEWIGAHHERPDGRGYPEMLEGDQVPWEARILAVADVYEALTADRPHRAALPKEEALVVIEGLAGTQLDPMVVAALTAVL